MTVLTMAAAANQNRRGRDTFPPSTEIPTLLCGGPESVSDRSGSVNRRPCSLYASQPYSRRMLGLAVQALAGRFLSGRAPAGPLVRPLRFGLRYGRDQQFLLPLACARDIREVAAAGAAQLS